MFCDRGREARRGGREVGDEGAGSGDRGAGNGDRVPHYPPPPLRLISINVEKILQLL